MLDLLFDAQGLELTASEVGGGQGTAWFLLHRTSSYIAIFSLDGYAKSTPINGQKTDEFNLHNRVANEAPCLAASTCVNAFLSPVLLLSSRK